MNCPDYRAPFQAQLKEPNTGRYDCTAYSAAVVIATSTCGTKTPLGRTIRLQSDERIPDPSSPGLNLRQVAAVARDHYGVYLDVQTGWHKLAWTAYEKRRIAGQPTIVQVSYAPIEASAYNACPGFRGGHAMAETLAGGTYDSLADGRRAGIHKYDGKTYPRSLIREAAGKLVIGTAGPGPITVGQGYVWAAFGRDVVPSYRVSVPRGTVLVYGVSDAGVVTGRRQATTAGFSASCSVPRSHPWPSKDRTVTLVKVTSGPHSGWHISAKYASEV